MTDLIDIVTQINERRFTIEHYRDYFLGNHRNEFIGEKLNSDFGDKLESLSCNRCGIVIDTLADRLEIAGFDGQGEEQATALFEEQQLALLAGEVHQEALITGDAFVIVWPDETSAPRFVLQHSEQMAVIYDSENSHKLYVAGKVWRRRDGSYRLNLYYEDRLEKYVTIQASLPEPPAVAAQWTQHMDDGDLAWPLTYSFGRVPVLHFRNNARSGEYGRSELADVIPLQDRLNQTLANLAIAEEFQSFAQRWVTGIQPQKDPDTGEVIPPFKLGADRLWVSTSDETKFGQFDPGDLRQLLETAEATELRIARTARIPIHYFMQSGTPPSGESLKTAEAPFLAKVKDRQISFGVVWADALGFALSLQGFANARLTTLWTPAETRSDNEFWTNALLKKEVGVSPRQIMIEAGYTAEQVVEMEQETIDDALVMQPL